MASWPDVILGVAGKTQESAPPQQWIWAAVLLVISMIAGFVLSRELNREALAKAELQIAEKKLADAKRRAEAAATQAEAAALRLQTEILAKDIVSLESQLAYLAVSTKAKADAISRAKSWKELDSNA